MSSDGSAYFGEPPLSSGDVTIMKGLFGSTKPPKRVPVPPGEPKTAAPGLVVGLSFAIVIVVFITGARLLTRIFRKGQVFGWDDWIVIPGVGIALAYFANLLVRTQTGCAGKHMNDCTYKELGVFTTLGAYGQIMFFAAVILIKISMCLFVRRVTGISSRPWQIVNNIFLGILILFFFITLFINIFQCSPVTAFFNYAIKVDSPTYHCLDTGKISNAFSIINCVTDFCLLAIPIFIITKIQMPWGRKSRLIGVFCIGIACCICSAYRSSLGYRHSKDVTFIFVSEVSWTVADVFFSAVVASLPALNAMAEIAWSKAASSFGSKGLKSSGNASSGKSWSKVSDGSANRNMSGADRSTSQVRGLSKHGERNGSGEAGRGAVEGKDGEVLKDGTRRYSMEVTDVEMGGFKGRKDEY